MHIICPTALRLYVHIFKLSPEISPFNNAGRQVIALVVASDLLLTMLFSYTAIISLVFPPI